jgi:hypothetical protein
MNHPHWSEEHVNPEDEEMFLNIDASSDLESARWCLYDGSGDSVVLDWQSLTWLATLLPQIRHSYLSARKNINSQSTPTTEA